MVPSNKGKFLAGFEKENVGCLFYLLEEEASLKEGRGLIKRFRGRARTYSVDL